MIGAIIVIVGIVLMVMIHEAGHFVAAKAFGMKATEFFFGFGPRLWSFRRGETEYGVKAIPLGGYVRVIGMNPFEEVATEDEGRTYRSGKFWQKSVVVLAGVGSNFAIAFLILYFVAIFEGEPDLDQPLTVVAAVVEETVDGEPTAALVAGIEAGDRIDSINGIEVDDWDMLVAELRDHPNETVALVVERDGELFEVGATLTARFDEEEGRTIGFLGVAQDFAVDRDNPVTAFGTAGDQFAFLITESSKGMWALVTGIGDLVSSVFQGDEIQAEARPLSPIGIARLGAASEEVGLALTFTLIAWINIFVGLLNVLPIYPLDGGHFSVALYEKVTGREPDVRKLVPVAAAVVVFLLLLGVLGVYLDIVDPLELR